MISGRLSPLFESELRMKPRVYIETFGCQMNVADSERAATGLRASGYDLCESAEDADVVLLNTCSVREKAERKVTRVSARFARSNRESPLHS
jgi:tRNA-2-methylthio-N6-dimethylallyladenosine synthase